MNAIGTGNPWADILENMAMPTMEPAPIEDWEDTLQYEKDIQIH